MGAVLALASSLCYGLADFAGGLLSRRASSTAIAFTAQLGGLVLVLIAAPVVPAPSVTAADLGWGALSGAGTGIGMLFLYRGLSHGAMSIVVPLSAVGGLALPVLAGVVLLGDRPSILAWLGIVLAAPTLWLVAQTGRRLGGRPASGTSDSLLAGVGIAVQYLALAQAGGASGIWPVAAGRVAAVLAILPMVTSPALLRLSPGLWIRAAANGGLAALALVLYLAATRYDLVSIAVVLSSLYPVIPVLLGVVALRERLSRRQALGLVGAGVSVGFLTA